MVDIPWYGASGLILITIIAIAVIALWRINKELKSGFPLQDERTRIITGKAATFAFNIGSYFMLALMLANLIYLQSHDTPILDTGYALLVSLMVQNLSFIVFQYYFNVKEG
jgi:hypothetical protein